MPDEDAFRVAVKPSAIDATDAARALVADRGEVVAFPSEDAAVAEAERLSRDAAAGLRVQRAAPQDPAAVDAYLIAWPDRRTHDPVESADGRMTFETTAHQYGAIGEALLLSYGANPPPLAAYVSDDLQDGTPGGEFWVDVDRDPDPVVFGGAEPATWMRWVPDCVATARETATGAALRTYWCEIKTGDASFGRDQADVMAYKAHEAPVLSIRVDVTGLPDRYSVGIREVDARAPPAGIAIRRPGDARLDDFA